MRLMKIKYPGFSLVELVIVIVILGIVTSIGVNRMNRFNDNARNKAAKTNLQIIRNAVDRYYCEHRMTYPGAKPDGMGNSAKSMEAFKNQLTLYTNIEGKCSEDKDPAFPFGPYIRGDIPDMPFGDNTKDNTVTIKDDNNSLTPDANGGNGWLFNPNTGEVQPNRPDLDKF